MPRFKFQCWTRFQILYRWDSTNKTFSSGRTIPLPKGSIIAFAAGGGGALAVWSRTDEFSNPERNRRVLDVDSLQARWTVPTTNYYDRTSIVAFDNRRGIVWEYLNPIKGNTVTRSGSRAMAFQPIQNVSISFSQTLPRSSWLKLSADGNTLWAGTRNSAQGFLVNEGETFRLHDASAFDRTNEVVLRFNQRLSLLSATNPINYEISPPQAILAARLDPLAPGLVLLSVNGSVEAI